METIKSFTDLPQSKTLSTILPPESADMVYIATTNDDIGDYLYTAMHKSEFIIREDDEDCIPCWSLAALLDNIPHVKLESIERNGKLQWICYSFFNTVLHGKKVLDWRNSDLCDNLVDACYDIILQLHNSKNS